MFVDSTHLCQRNDIIERAYAFWNCSESAVQGAPLKFFKKSDLIILSALLILSVAVWAGVRFMTSQKASKAEIYYYSDLVESIDLSAGEERVFSIPQEPNVVLHLYKDGSIRFEKSDCPDKICIHTGQIHTIGETAACLPNGVLIKIVPAEGYDKDDLDIVVGK